MHKLQLKNIRKDYGNVAVVDDLSLDLRSGELVTLLGPSGCGKTTTLRMIAGFIELTAGSIAIDGSEISSARRTVPPEHRGMSMIFQSYAIWPNMTVAENVGFGLKVRRVPGDEMRQRVHEMLEVVHLSPLAHRYPAELSGGQQQRVALARALAKGAPLMLLDEPLVNLDYKLREELREELTQLFAAGDSTVVYATTEPGEALLLGGHTAVLDAGELLQYGPTAQVFHHPVSLRVARAFSDPPMNLVAALPAAHGVQLVQGPALAMELPAAPATRLAALTAGIRGSSLRVTARPGDAALPGRVELAEISGSSTYVHVATAVGELVAQLTGVHHFDLGAPLTLYLAPAQVYLFDAAGALLVAPLRQVGPAGQVRQIQQEGAAHGVH